MGDLNDLSMSKCNIANFQLALYCYNGGSVYINDKGVTGHKHDGSIRNCFEVKVRYSSGEKTKQKIAYFFIKLWGLFYKFVCV